MYNVKCRKGEALAEKRWQKNEGMDGFGFSSAGYQY
jgi:hypothetical protein